VQRPCEAIAPLPRLSPAPRQRVKPIGDEVGTLYCRLAPSIGFVIGVGSRRPTLGPPRGGLAGEHARAKGSVTPGVGIAVGGP